MPTVQIPELPKIGKVDALELQLFWHRFFSDPRYKRNLMKRILKGDAAHMEILLHHMTYGKPKETLALQNPGDGQLVLIIGGQKLVELSSDGQGFVTAAGELPAASPPAEAPPEASHDAA